jgi:hypothetical protein
MENFSKIESITNWTDIEKRSDFIPILTIQNEDEAKNRLKQIIATYQISPKVRCGISRCQTKHNYGYLVKLDTNQEIIIGKDCGKKYFGAEFTTQKNLLNALKLEAENFKIIQDKYNQLEEIKSKFNSIIMPINSLGLHKIVREIKKLTSGNEEIDYWMVRELAHSSKISRSGEIKEKVYKSFEEIEQERELKATSQNLEYDATSDQGEIKVKDTKIVVLGKVENFEIIYDLYEIETKIKYFQEIHNQIKDPTKMTKQDRKKLVKRLREYTSNLYEIESFVRKGNNLLKEENISKLEHVFKEKSAKDKIKKWAKRLKETA